MGKKTQQDSKKQKKSEEVISKKKQSKKDRKAPLKERKIQKKQEEEKEFENENENSIEETKDVQDELKIKEDESLKVVKDKIISSINQEQIKKAVKALTQIIKNRTSQNINVLSNEQDELLYVNFIFDTFPIKYSIKPNSIKISNSLYSEKYNTPVCIFVKDPKSDFKEMQLEFPFEVKVIDVTKLKVKYDRFEQRRNLLKQYEIFLCDSRIYFVLKKLLGKPFYVAKKFPIPVKIDYQEKEKTKQEIIDHVKGCTFFTMSNGPIYNVKFARQVMNEKEKVKNLNDAIQNTLPHILKYDLNYEELKTITIRGNNTIELPIYHHLKEEEIKMYLEAEK